LEVEEHLRNGNLSPSVAAGLQHQMTKPKKTITRLALLALLTAPAWAQSLSVGVRAGVPLSDAFDVFPGRFSFRNLPHHWTAGPTIEVRLPFSLGVTFDALYSRVEYERIDSPGGESGGQWEFPLMLRFRSGAGPVHPFVAGGASFNKLTDISAPTSSAAGVVVGAGVELKVPFVRITPEIRYTRRFSDQLNLEGLRSNRNELVFLTGITF
jgi:Outer membrane protein beta-barrel domain